MVSEIIFMQEGSSVFHKSVDELKKETQVDKISQAIIHILKQKTI
jgi:Cu-processing system ATP-binding protein